MSNTFRTRCARLWRRAGAASLLALTLLGCGGGGASDGRPMATIHGTTSATVTLRDPVTENMLTVQAPDTTPLSFIAPNDLAGAYGDWSVQISGATAIWRYTLQPQRLPAHEANQPHTDSLQLRSSDGSATQTLKVAILPTEVTKGTEVVQSSYPPDSAPAEVFEYLNRQRTHCGLGRLSQDSRIDAAAAAHAQRQIANNKTGHDEHPADIGFTGIGPADRLRAAGYPLWSFPKAGAGRVDVASEVIGYLPSALASIRALLAAPYHMATAVAQYRDVGIAFETTSVPQRVRSALVLNFGVHSSVAAYQQAAPGTLLTFPCEGTTDLAPSFTESSDWRGGQGIGFGGAPMLVMAPNFERVRIASAQLTGPDGASMPVHVLTHENDPQRIIASSSMELVIPEVELAPNTRYHWSVQGTIGGVPFSRSFSFATGANAR